MVRTAEEIINSVKERIGDDTSDEALSLLEDVSDTLGDFSHRMSDTTDWKAMYEENDASWRQKYKDRFMNPPSKEEQEFEEKEDKPAPKTFADLFTTV